MSLLSRLFRNTHRRPARRSAARPALRCRPSLQVLDERALPSSNSFDGLGAAGYFGVLEINGGYLSMNSSHILGNVGQGPNSTSVLQKTDISGAFYVDPTATPDLSNVNKDFLPAGGVITFDLSQAQSDANATSTTYAAMAPTQTLGNVTSSVTVTGNGGTNVISVGSLNYNGKTLTVSGSANDVFVFNVSGDFSFYKSTIKLTGGVTANHVLFNFTTAGSDVDLSKSTNVINGTFLAPQGTVIYHNPAAFNGAIIAKNIYIHSDANLNKGDTTPPPTQPPTGQGASLSGTVYVDDNTNHVRDANEVSGLEGILITLTGTDIHGNAVFRETWTDGDGHYSFAGLEAGTYQLTKTPLDDGFSDFAANPGTVNGMTHGTALGLNTILDITLVATDVGVNFDFGEVPPAQ